MSQQKTGLMYSDAFASYKASDGYLCLSADSNPWISTTDYYDTPERVTEAYELLAKSGLLSKLTPIAPRSATKSGRSAGSRLTRTISNLSASWMFASTHNQRGRPLACASLPLHLLSCCRC